MCKLFRAARAEWCGYKDWFRYSLLVLGFVYLLVIPVSCGLFRPAPPPVSVRQVVRDSTYIIPGAELRTETPTYLPVFLEKRDTVAGLRMTVRVDTYYKRVYAECDKEPTPVTVTKTETETVLAPRIEEKKGLPWWAWVLFAVGGILFFVLACIIAALLFEFAMRFLPSRPRW